MRSCIIILVVPCWVLVAQCLVRNKNRTMKTINIYLNKQEKLTANKVSSRYRVSMSTIADKCSYWLFYLITKYGSDELMDQLTNEYIDSKGNYKTCIKPKNKDEYIGQAIKNPSRFYSNALKIYLNHKIKDYISNNDAVNLYYNKIDQELQKAEDPYWNYNQQIRNFRRIIRQNPDYIKKALAEQGN